MNGICNTVVFSNKAYNAIISETFHWDPVETGGFLLGQRFDNGVWFVIEAIPPGYSENARQDRVFHEMGYFEPNTSFSQYMANTVADQYELPLKLLGLWHRHPGSMDFFSGTDDETNARLSINDPSGMGIISGLVNVDSQFRMTMRYVPNDQSSAGGHPNYEIVDVHVGSDLIPEDFLKLRYFQGAESDIHPLGPKSSSRQAEIKRENNRQSSDNGKTNDIDIGRILNEQLESQNHDLQQPDIPGSNQDEFPDLTRPIEDIFDKLKKNKRTFYFFVFLLIVVFCFSVILFYKGVRRFFTSSFVTNKEYVIEPSVIEKDTIIVEKKEINASQEIENVEPKDTNN